MLETEFETDEDVARVMDFMPRGGGAPCLMRIVEGVNRGATMRMELSLRPDHASIIPWVEFATDGIAAIAAGAKGVSA